MADRVDAIRAAHEHLDLADQQTYPYLLIAGTNEVGGYKIISNFPASMTQEAHDFLLKAAALLAQHKGQ
jgi:hypothetical protein